MWFVCLSAVFVAGGFFINLVVLLEKMKEGRNYQRQVALGTVMSMYLAFSFIFILIFVSSYGG